MQLQGTVVAGPASVAFITDSGKQVVAHIGDPIGQFTVETRDDDCEAPSRAVRSRLTVAGVSHDAASPSNMWPNFERFVAM